MNWLMDKLFGRIYRKGWPRGVKPMFPEVRWIRENDPDLWRATRHLPPSEAYPIWQDKHLHGEAPSPSGPSA